MTSQFRNYFKYGRYDWLGQYRFTSIMSAVKKLYPEADSLGLDANIPLDAFHACYLLDTSTVADDHLLEAVTKPIISDAELRQFTVADDLVSRVFAARFTVEFLRQLRRVNIQPPPGQGAMSVASGGGDATASPEAAPSPGDLKRIGEAAERAAREAKGYAGKVRDYLRLGREAGVGHVEEFGDLINIDFAVDASELLRLFSKVVAEVGVVRRPSPLGSPEGYRLGRDLRRLAPTALMYDDCLFWYRYAAGTLPVLDLMASATERVAVVLDKSGSMKEGNKTAWSRAVALAVVKTGPAVLMYFDDTPSKPISDRSEVLRVLLTLRCGGGTSIDSALKAADRLEGVDRILLITDGEDRVGYRPGKKLTTVFVAGDNEGLRRISDEYCSVEPSTAEAVRVVKLVRGP